MAKPNKHKASTHVNYQKLQRQKEKQLPTPHNMQPDVDGEVTLNIYPYDTWYFRESRPHDAVGASELTSLFPPPVRTLAGAIRTFLGESIGINWKTLHSPLDNFDFQTALGNEEHLGQLQLEGPWICFQDQRLYPAPLYLLRKDDDIRRLEIGPPVSCDLGEVRLPTLTKGLQGYKNLEQCWLTHSGIAECLNGNIPAKKDIIGMDQLVTHEARLGIARDNQTRNVQDGKLYQTRHLRLKEYVHIQMTLQDLDASLKNALPSEGLSAILRLGGEGRMASIQCQTASERLPLVEAKKCKTVLLHFVTPADFNGKLYPDDFERTEINDQTVWKGNIHGIELQIESAVIGKVYREGGWDMHNHQPRPVKSYVPAGSAWYCRLTQEYDWETLLKHLQGCRVGHDTAFGRGQILLGTWHDTHNA